MSDTTNTLTDTLKLVQVHPIRGRRIFPQVVSPETGFSWELFRNGIHHGSTRSNQALNANGGDVLYRINLGPAIQSVAGYLYTQDGYTREYSMMVEIQVIDPLLFLEIYLQGGDPVNLVLLGIKEAVQIYADRTGYEQIHAANIQAKAMYAFDGESGKLRAGMRVIRVYQPSLKADETYQPNINLSPFLEIKGQLITQDGYMRDYTSIVELQVTDRGQYLQLDHEKARPKEMAEVTIVGELKKYALQQRYEDLTEPQLITIVEHAFDTLSSRITSCMKIVRTHHLSLEGEPINISPVLEMKGQLTTLEGYVRTYEVSVEFLITDLPRYQQRKYEGVDPLKHASVAIDGELQRYARQQFYEDLIEARLSTIVEHAFDTLSSRAIDGLKIVHSYHLSLERNSTYQPINLSPLLKMDGQLTTKENYKRNYALTVELLVTDRQKYLQISREGVDPIELAKAAITGELQKETREQFYEDFSESQLRAIVEHAFDHLSNRVTEGMKIVGTRSLSLGEDNAYQPINLSPLLEMKGQLTTREGYVRAYEVPIELLITDMRRYQQLKYAGVDPLERASIAIDGEIKKYACQQTYEDLTESQLSMVVERAFDEPSSNVTSDMKIIRTHHFSLYPTPDYINLGPRMLNITGRIKTTDYRERGYEMTVELEVADAPDFVRFTRQGNDPPNLVRIAIEGVIQRTTADKTHDELLGSHLHQAALVAFDPATNPTIGGMKIVAVHTVVLEVDSRIQEEKDITHQAVIEITKREQQATLEKMDDQLNFEKAKSAREYEHKLTEIHQDTEKAQYLFELEKKAAAAQQQLRNDIIQKVTEQLMERMRGEVETEVPISQLVESSKAVLGLVQPPPMQISSGNTVGEYDQTPDDQYPQSHILESRQPDLNVPQISSATSTPRRNKMEIPEWGLLLVECRLSADLRDIISNQERAFLVMEVSEDALAQNSPFQDSDILLKINGQKAYTREAIEAALKSIQPAVKIKVVVLRGELPEILTLNPFYDADNNKQNASDALEQE